MNSTTLEAKPKRATGHEIAVRSLADIDATITELEILLHRDDEPSSEDSFLGLVLGARQARSAMQSALDNVRKHEIKRDAIDGEIAERWKGVA